MWIYLRESAGLFIFKNTDTGNSWQVLLKAINLGHQLLQIIVTLLVSKKLWVMIKVAKFRCDACIGNKWPGVNHLRNEGEVGRKMDTIKLWISV